MALIKFGLVYYPEGMLTRSQDSVTVCGITNMSFVELHTLQKVRIQFQVALRKGNGMYHLCNEISFAATMLSHMQNVCFIMARCIICQS